MFRHIEQDLEIWISQRDILQHLEICASSVEGFVRNRGSETVAATLRQHAEDIAKVGAA
jgi:hypothetical protein